MKSAATSGGEENHVYEMSGDAGSMRYKAPEVAKSEPYNHKADIYAFGLILWQMCALKTPFEDLNADNFHEVVVEGGERPQINAKIAPEPIVALIERCWSNDLQARPESNEIINALRNEIAAHDADLLDELDVSNRTDKSDNDRS